jgi:osmotically-inducible protein OsmY
MKTDAQLKKDVQDELRFQPNVRETEIGVAVKDGVVTLSGFVDSYAQKLAAERAAENVSGVRAVAEELKVKLAHSFLRSDTEIAEAAVSALKWNVEVPDQRIKLRVEDGYVTMEGDVDWQFQKNSAYESVRHLMGVKGVRNVIAVRQPKASAYEVSQKIQEAFKRSATIDSQKISVETIDGRVVLKGTVRSWAERQDAERAAYAAPGVTMVDDLIAVGV